MKQIEKEMREKIIRMALLQYHKEYIHGQMGPESFDCAGLVWYIYHRLFNIDVFCEGIGISTTTKIMTSKYGMLTLFEKKSLKKDISLIKKGDVILFHRQALQDSEPKIDNKYPGHCGIYLGDNKFIHAFKPNKKVIISTLNNPRWNGSLIGSKDFVQDDKILIKYKSISDKNK